MPTLLLLHPGHVTEGGFFHTLRHLVSSPYHVAVIAALMVLVVAVVLSGRPGRAKDSRREERA